MVKQSFISRFLEVPGGIYSSSETRSKMNLQQVAQDLIATYQKHGWQLKRVLLRPDTRTHFEESSSSLLDVQPAESEVDALWFSRPSHEGREAWELRLISENPYALFETFEQDETEEQREEMRLELEARLREYVTR